MKLTETQRAMAEKMGLKEDDFSTYEEKADKSEETIKSLMREVVELREALDALIGGETE